MKIEEKHILDFHDDYKPSNVPPKENGFYMTIRCGLGGIYTSLNEWDGEKWLMNVLDASKVIAYSKDLIPKEEVNVWCKEKLEKYKKKLV